MGSFASTCAVSGIPLEAGDPVRWYLLTENPYDDNLVCYSHDMWFPRSWPVRAEYNDYGSIENYDLKCPSIVSVIEALKEDIVEKGVGDNSCHDVPTAKGMSFEATLEAVWEKRIQVSREVDTIHFMDPVAKKRASNYPKNVAKPIPGFPTLRGVEDLLKNAGYQIVTSEPNTNTHAGDAYMVDELELGMCRIRVNGYAVDPSKLEAILPLLQQEYAAVITVGSRSYAHSTEIRLMPKVMKRAPDVHVFWGHKDDKKQPLNVFQGMIHEDVWNELLKMKVENDWDEKEIGFDQFRVDAENLWKKAISQKNNDSVSKILARHDNSHVIMKSAIPFTVGPSEHWQIVTQRHIKEKFTAKQVDEFLDDVAGFSLISYILQPVRYWWRPSFTCGPQFGEHKKHIDMFAAFRRATMNAKKRRAY